MKWISVKERLPTKAECKKNAGWFLVWRSFGHRRGDIKHIATDRYDGHEDYYLDDLKYDPDASPWKYPYGKYITHWMEYPEPPHD